ncbi:MAG: tetratricopeptide repeat protein [Candidatus Latescibacterota bacterium]|nr:MAG: tetratricopeptide repeat protein [Candidatus Latescibacterota bacterium]
MTRAGVKIILVLLYIAAVWLRLNSLSDIVYPYYKGVSATNYRQTLQVIEDGTLPEIDQRAAWPDGFEPSRVKPNGVEYLAGFVFRFAAPFTDMPEQRFVRRFIVLLSSLSVFTIYGLVRRLWSCQAAAVFAAFLTTATVPLIQLTNGSQYLHAPIAVVLVSLHLIFVLAAPRGRVVLNTLLAALTAVALLAAWDSAALYLVVVSCAILLFPRLANSVRARLLVGQLTAIMAAGLILPHLQARRFILDWPTFWVLSTTLYAFFGHRLPRKVPGLAYVAGGTVILTFTAKSIQSGGLDVLSSLDYWYHRVRYLTGKPDDPSLLSAMLRNVWTHDHSYPRAYTVFAFFLPLLFMAVPALAGLRELRGKIRFAWSIPSLVVGIGILVMLLDRQAIPFAGLLLFPIVSAALFSFRAHIRTRLAPVAIAALLVAINAWAPTGPANPMFRIGSALGMSPTVPDGFHWVSLGNADAGLIRHVLTRTSARHDVVLATPEQSSLINTFAGRITVLVPGVHTRAMTDRATTALGLFYSSEDELHKFCADNGVTYVLYSIDMLLDTSRYSPLYLAGRTSTDETSVAYTMHFAPETLRHFHLVFENDNYRLFRVTGQVQPLFITDHPPVYQPRILRDHGDDFESFYARIVDILLAYQSGVDEQSRGNDQGAIPRFRYSLDRAPLFTRARLGEGDSHFRLGDYESALDSYRRVISYAPDNTHALYYAALCLAYLGRGEEAMPLIDLIFSATGDRDTRLQASELKAILESGQPLVAPGPQKQNPRETPRGEQ